MSDFDRALAQISAIRNQMAKATEFRGYGPATFAVTGAVAALAGLAQQRWLIHPAAQTTAWLALWIAVATVSAAVIGVEMVGRSRRLHVHLANDMIRAAVEQFLPAAVAGGALTAILASAAPQSLWMLPGLWQILFGLGVFASCRFLPRPMLLVGCWYLGTGLLCLALGGGVQALAPWTMAAPFGVGQVLVAAVLRLSAGGGDD
ncbi:hypothetical protein ACO2Q3_08315 [Caulobacter sp. KR2-114]|uniref:hypothetical protein n=1 Tax=Caulobacter sp. KR2-114 TaxID=3400912 RepID=UPI003C00D6DF